MVKLGNKVRDTITGFTGVAVARTDWLYGCSRIGVEQAGLDKDGKPLEVQWFDEQRVQVVADDGPTVSPDSAATSGGPKRDPARPSDPHR